VEGVVVDRSFWAGRRVLVTGHTGFKGAWLSLWLASLGAEVTGMALPAGSPSLYGSAGVGSDVVSSDVSVDVRDFAAVSSFVAAAAPSVVFHLAAQPLVRASYADPAGTWDTNVMGTAHVLEALRLSGASLDAVVVVTSDKCYRNLEEGRPFREDDPLGGHDPYSASKAGAELVAAAYRDSYGLPVSTARAGNVIGGGDWSEDRLVPDAFRAVRSGSPLRVRSPGATRPWQHVLCPLHGYMTLAASGLSGAWNFGPALGDARPVSWVVDRLGVPWKRDGGEHPYEAGFLSLDSTKAHEELGWEPRWDLERGIEETAAWYQAGDDADLRALTLSQIEEYMRN
jgi:CDP-glucose 4,6-dehydratase